MIVTGDAWSRTLDLAGQFAFPSRTEIGRYWFEWGRTPALGHRTPDFAVELVGGERKVRWYNLNNRQPETTYYWRACADDSDPERPDPGCRHVLRIAVLLCLPASLPAQDSGPTAVVFAFDSSWASGAACKVVLSLRLEPRHYRCAFESFQDPDLVAFGLQSSNKPCASI